MARPERNTVDYFPHLIGDGKKISFIEHKYGNDGYATWFKILESLASTDYHFLNLNDEVAVMYLAVKCKVSEDRLLDIIEDLVKLKTLSKEAWSMKVVWSQIFIDSIEDAYIRRNNKCMHFEGLIQHLSSLGIHYTLKTTKLDYSNTQSKVNESKVDDINKINITVDFVKLVDFFNSVTGKKAKVVSKKVKEQINARIKDGFTKEDIIAAIKNCFADDYHKETGHKHLTLEFITRADKLEKYSSITGKSPDTKQVKADHLKRNTF